MQEQINSNRQLTSKYGNKFKIVREVKGEKKKTRVPIWNLAPAILSIH